MADGDQRFADLQELSPEEITDPEKVVDDVFTRLCEGFEPERTHGEGGVFRFLIETATGPISRLVIVEDGKCNASAGSEPEPGVTLSLSLADFLDLATGKLDGPDAFASGKLTVSGDLFLAMRWGEWFGAE